MPLPCDVGEALAVCPPSVARVGRYTGVPGRLRELACHLLCLKYVTEGLGAVRSRDAVIVVPGIMGSELMDSTNGHVLWGLSDPRWYVNAWTSGSSLNALRLTDAEREGRYGRIKATRLLRFPAFAPMLRGMEPYTRLLKSLNSVVVHPDAVAEFAYDWRLPIAHNAGLLATALDRYLAEWRRHPAQIAARRNDPDETQAQAVIVAHSMGGLIARHLCLIDGVAPNVRATITLGTPFYGSPKAAVLLSSARAAPAALPRSRLRRLAAGLPGVHDLLPNYRCVDTGSGARSLTGADISSLGGDGELADAAFQWHRRIDGVLPPGHVQVVGAHQPTIQSLTMADGVASGHYYTCRPLRGEKMERIDLFGDGTVPRESAQLPHAAAMPLAQSHGAIARTAEVILIVQDVIANRLTGPWQGVSRIGLEAPDVVRAGQMFEVALTGADGPRQASIAVIDISTERRIAAPEFTSQDGRVVAHLQLHAPGLYRILVTGGGFSSISEIVLVADSDSEGDGDEVT
jgi:pimeloyl-ACP methyl ester carboxylesterase